MNANTGRFLRDKQPWAELPDILSGYTVLDCLAGKEHVQTYLVERCEDGALCVLKMYDSGSLAAHEAGILRGLSHPGIPQVLAQADEYILLSYAEGTSAAELRAMPGFSSDYAVELVDKLCGILGYLHSQSPPVIHRDIKPEHIIIREDGTVSLIDFEVSRVYNPNENTDTIHALTPAFAAPEQFGYAQSDIRSDVYAVGVLLLYLLSGSTEVEKIDKLVNARALARVIRRCTAFSPRDRYQDTDALRRALHRTRSQAVLQRRWMAVVAVVIAIALCTGFWAGSWHMHSRLVYTGTPDNPVVLFEEPLVESAVRARLGLDLKTPIHQSDLDTVTELFLMGNRPAATMGEYWVLCEHSEAIEAQPGSVVTLSDLTRMPNLQELYLNGQQITHLDELATLGQLRILDFRNNTKLTDLSGLSDKPFLEALSLDGSGVYTLDDLAGVPIAILQVGGLSIDSIEPLRGNEALQELGIGYTHIDDLSPLLTMPNLEYVWVTNYPEEKIDELRPFSFVAAFSEEDIPQTES